MLIKNKGFTLIELIVAIGILGILAVAAIMALDPVAQLQKSNDTRRKSDLAQVQRALETYYQDNNKYPIVTATPYQITGTSWGTSWQPYINVLPKDPTSRKYIYYSTNGQTYYIYASLERGTSDPAVCKNLNANGECSSIDTNVISTKSCGGPCNYGVSSPNVTP
jgi:type IV pilus assembly protein PilE